MPTNRNTRRRKTLGPMLTSKSRILSNQPWTNNTSFDLAGKQITVSEGHQWPPLKKEGLVDRGGDFFTSKSFSYGSNGSYVKLDAVHPGSGLLQSFEGNLSAPFDVASPITPTGYNPAYPPTLQKSDAEMDALGATAISRCKPGEPVADLSTFLGELLKDGLPSVLGLSLLKDRRRPTKSASGEYLNYQFGYQPIVKDGMKIFHAVADADKVLRQYERDSGKVVRRRYSFPTEVSSSNIPTLLYPLPFPGTQIPQYVRSKYSLEGGTPVITRTVSRDVWFSGAFTYFLPSDYESSSRIKEYGAKVNALLGTDLTIDTLWNVAPWSWAVDWFSNTGDVISNIQDFRSQGLILHYGYLMVHTIVTDNYSLRFSTSSPSRPSVPDVNLVTETKQRRRANPFGFGVSWGGLSPFQLSIAAALGLSRGR